MNKMTGFTRGGRVWVPAFIKYLNQNACIGCGRCYKVCSRAVFELIDRSDLDSDDDDEEESDGKKPGMVMTIKDFMDCIGCQACARVCTKSCLSHESISAP